MHWAAEVGNIEASDVLIEHGLLTFADKDFQGNTPLHIGVQMGQKDYISHVFESSKVQYCTPTTVVKCLTYNNQVFSLNFVLGLRIGYLGR